MPVLAASLATNPRAADSPLRTSTLVAQAGGWGGDVALLGEGTKPFLAGVGSFGVGHVAYLAGFLRQHGHSAVREAAGPTAVAGSWALTAPVMAFLAARRKRELGGPVLRVRHHARGDGGGRELPRHRPAPVGATADRRRARRCSWCRTRCWASASSR